MSSMDNSQDDIPNGSSQKNCSLQIDGIHSADDSVYQANHYQEHKWTDCLQQQYPHTNINKQLKDSSSIPELMQKLRQPFSAQDVKAQENAQQLRQRNKDNMMHPNFSGSETPLDPNRPLTDIPDPTPRYLKPLQQILSTQLDHKISAANNQSNASKWALIASPELASHLELLQIGGLLNLPNEFFASVASTHQSIAPLLSSLTQLTLLDMSDIQQACAKYPNLTRYGFTEKGSNTDYHKNFSQSVTSEELASTFPEMLNDIFAPSWEVILYPERFDNGIDSLATDLLACSVAVHVLKQCQTRKTINRQLTAQQICQHMRSYVLSQCNSHPQFAQQYRQIRLFVGHVVVAAHYLGLSIVHASHHAVSSVTNSKGETSRNLGQPIYLNVSSRSALFSRYPNISNYYINGWS